MTARVTALGYLRFTATDLDHWQDFGQRVLGLMADRRGDDRLLFRVDEKSYRLEVRPGERGGVSTVGWETRGPAELAGWRRAWSPPGTR